MDNQLLIPILLSVIVVLALIVWHLAHELKEMRDSLEDSVAMRKAERLILKLPDWTPGREAWLTEFGSGIEAEAIRRATSDYI